MGPAPFACATPATTSRSSRSSSYVTLFLLVPTAIVVIGAFQTDDGVPTFQNIVTVVSSEAFREAFVRSISLSAQTAIIGRDPGGPAGVGGRRFRPGSWLRRNVIAACGVLAQFGGVMLAFAFLATFGFNGIATMFMREVVGVDALGGNWIYGMTGLAVVYTYFQIPLMVIIFLPALEGLRKEWWEASTSLGGSGWSYWRHVGGPILAPAFLGALLLLFANAFSAYATAAALVSQGSPIVPLADPRCAHQRRRGRAGECRQGPRPGDDRRRHGRHDRSTRSSSGVPRGGSSDRGTAADPGGGRSPAGRS